MNFLDNFIPDRIRIIKEDKDPIHIYEVLSKHFDKDIDELKKIYNITLNMRLREVHIEGNFEDIYYLTDYAKKRNVTLKSMTQKSMDIDIDQFLRKIY